MIIYKKLLHKMKNVDIMKKANTKGHLFFSCTFFLSLILIKGD